MNEKIIQNQNLNINVTGSDSDSFSDEFTDEFLLQINNPTRIQIRKKNKLRMSVTDFTSINWCEKQYVYTKTKGKPSPTVSMVAGTKRHKQLEEEVHELIEIKTDSVLDVWGSIFLNAILRIDSLLYRNLAREVPVFGFFKLNCSENKVFVQGVIDLIEKKPKKSEESAECLFLSDNKTRLSTSLPKKIQSSNHELQLMIYKKLLDNLIACGKKVSSLKSFPVSTLEDSNSLLGDFDLFPSDLYNHLLLDDKDVFSDNFYSELLKYSKHLKLFHNFRSLEKIKLFDLFKLMLLYYGKLPLTSDHLVIIYEHQKTRNIIGETSFKFNLASTNKKIQSALECHFEVREAFGVTDLEEACFKCGNCYFSSSCNWRKTMAEQYTSKAH